MPIDLLNIPTEELKRILEIRQQMDALRNELNQLEGGGPGPTKATTPAPRGRPKGKRYVSPEARQRMAEAQRRRWAAKRKGGAAPVKAAAKGKRVMTAEWRAKIAAAQKARWAKQKGTEAPAEKPAAKKQVSPKKLAALAKARAARWAKAKAAK